MLTVKAEKTISRLLAFGIPATSMFILVDSVSDPVNVTKFLLLGGVGIGSLALIFFKGFETLIQVGKSQLILSFFFVLFSLVAVIFSNSPLTQNLYGVYGRNTGFLTYLFLVGIFLGSTLLNDKSSFRLLLIGLFVTGLVNIAYCAWVLTFGDFIGWSNPYGNILGLFGNPNFIGAFLGIWISATFAYFVIPQRQLKIKISAIVILLVASFEVYKSHAVQGVVVTLAGVSIALFFWIRSKTSNNLLLSLYTATVICLAFVATLGALQKGPLAEIIYKTSVSLRGAYWHAGIRMGLLHPLTGVGMDTYGDWYRRSRTEYNATVLPGPLTVTNSAHNVVLDIFSYGGFPLLCSYLGILVMGAWSILSIYRIKRNYDPIFVALTVAWAGYQLQSIISINQIGLAIWGWAFTGALIAYKNYVTKDLQSKSVNLGGTKSRGKRKGEVFSSTLVAGLGVTAGLILAAPPISADMAWFSATKSGNFISLENSLKSGYLRPQDSLRLANTITILKNSNLKNEALRYAQRATQFNPESFDSWLALYSLENSSQDQKRLALKNLKRLDPHFIEPTKP